MYSVMTLTFQGHVTWWHGHLSQTMRFTIAILNYFQQDAQLLQRNSASAMHDFLGRTTLSWNSLKTAAVVQLQGGPKKVSQIIFAITLSTASQFP